MGTREANRFYGQSAPSIRDGEDQGDYLRRIKWWIKEQEEALMSIWDVEVTFPDSRKGISTNADGVRADDWFEALAEATEGAGEDEPVVNISIVRRGGVKKRAD